MSSFGKFATTPSKAQFVRLVSETLRRAGETAGLHYDRNAFSLRSEGQSQRIFWLNNVYKEFCAARPEQRQLLLHNFVRSWLMPAHSVPESYEDVHPDLVPTVRARGYFEVTRLQLKAERHDAEDRPYRPVGGHSLSAWPTTCRARSCRSTGTTSTPGRSPSTKPSRPPATTCVA
jgi:hypothetical protein